METPPPPPPDHQQQHHPDDVSEDLLSLSFTSTATTATTTSSDATLTAASSISSSSSSTQPLLSFSDLKFLVRLGSGDIGSVYLAELSSPPLVRSPGDPTSGMFAAKVMDKKELASRNKEGRARTEMEILEMLDHPFLPSLYAAVDSPKWLCLLTEFCPGGDLHVLRQRQPLKRFEESAVRYATFFASPSPLSPRPPPPSPPSPPSLSYYHKILY
ncbi:hypothetical protein MLD38_040206 [Melastoma candidum]|uniref:Uncharacterized protein n=1 Tax=Melastoma candidum TaxID=119954 RepID=A0ACB9L5Q4_9MYRT|nr:hypothetical protein MLD38_040206 [Melastoma candidum]